MGLKGKSVAILATDGYEKSELVQPKRALEDAGVEAIVVSLTDKPIRAMEGHEWADTVDVDKTIDQISVEDVDAVMLPGGVFNPDSLRQDRRAVDFVRAAFDAKKPIAAICHGPWMLVEADVLKGREATSYPSVKTDMINAGAKWRDEAVVVHNGLITSRTPDDLEQFCKKLIEEVGEGDHPKRGPADNPAANQPAS